MTSAHPAYPRSATPIYDALYAEYQRLFRALPGDRTGEEEMRFEGFDRPARSERVERFERFEGMRSIGPGPSWGDPPRRHARAALPPAPRDGHRYGL